MQFVDQPTYLQCHLLITVLFTIVSANPSRKYGQFTYLYIKAPSGNVVHDLVYLGPHNNHPVFFFLQIAPSKFQSQNKYHIKFYTPISLSKRLSCREKTLNMTYNRAKKACINNCAGTPLVVSDNFQTWSQWTQKNNSAVHFILIRRRKVYFIPEHTMPWDGWEGSRTS